MQSRPNVGGRIFNNFGNSFNNNGRHFQDRGRDFNRGGAIAYPVYLGGYGSYAGYPEGGAYVDPSMQYGPPPQQQPNVTVIFPPQQPSPVVMYGGDSEYRGPSTRIYEPPPAAQTTEPEPESDRYLIAFKDKSIYATPAYWVEGDTIHYFTAGNAHNQASVSLIDRELTGKLNQGTTHEVKLPPAK